MEQLRVRRLAHALGAEVRGVDLARPLDERSVAEIRSAWAEHLLLCFPDQHLEPEGLKAFAAHFGTLDDNRRSVAYRHPDHAEVMLLLSKPVAGAGASGPPVYRAGRLWHTDQVFSERPTAATFLNAKDLPPVGGETMFANLQLAFESLSPAMQRLMESLEGVYDHLLSPNMRFRSPEERAADRALNPLVAHPMVGVHPATGRKTLYLDARLTAFAGMTEEESRPLVAFLLDRATRYEFVYRHRWSVGDAVMWDDRCTMHYAVQDYDAGDLRRMLRCALLGPKTGRAYV